MIRGFDQKKENDFFDTYSHVTKIATIQTLIALAAIHDLVVHQMDVKTTFLNDDLEEEIYMSQPEGVRGSRSREQSMQTKEIPLWSKASPQTVV